MTHTRKSIVTSILLLVSALPAAACIWMDSHNNYLYSLYDRQEFSDRADCATNAIRPSESSAIPPMCAKLSLRTDIL